MKQMKTSRKAGFTLVEIMIVVAIIGLLAAIAIPNFLRARSTSQQNACIENLRQIDSAKQQWALESGGAANSTPADTDIQKYLGRGGANGGVLDDIHCPLLGGTGTFDASYTPGNMSTTPVCKIGGSGGSETDANFLHVLK